MNVKPNFSVHKTGNTCVGNRAFFPDGSPWYEFSNTYFLIHLKAVGFMFERILLCSTSSCLNLFTVFHMVELQILFTI